jgi:hypothetical protein
MEQVGMNETERTVCQNVLFEQNKIPPCNSS